MEAVFVVTGNERIGDRLAGTSVVKKVGTIAAVAGAR
jgi:hypothetical protein